MLSDKRQVLVLAVDPKCPCCEGLGTLPSGLRKEARVVCECVRPQAIGNRFLFDENLIEGVRYVCGGCGVSGVKLWRHYQTFLEHQQLYCVACAEVEEGSQLDLDRTDQLGRLVPAVPTEGTFWGYTSVPEEGVRWWRDLPLRKPVEG